MAAWCCGGASCAVVHGVGLDSGPRRGGSMLVVEWHCYWRSTICEVGCAQTLTKALISFIDYDTMTPLGIVLLLEALSWCFCTHPPLVDV